MDDFIFDLQRFDEVKDLSRDPLEIIFAGNVARSISSEKNLKATLIANSDNTETVGAVISLSAADDNFYVDTDERKFHYKLNSKGTDGVIITIGSGASSTIDSIDTGDVFQVTDSLSSGSTTIKFSKFNNGLLLDNTLNGAEDNFIADSALSSIVLDNVSPASSIKGLHKVVEVDNKTLNITAASDFSKIGYAMDTNVSNNGSPTIYAELTPRSTNYKYGINTVAGSGTNSLSTINISDTGVLSSGVQFDKDFAGENGSTPTIIAGTTTLHADKASNSFVLSRGRNNQISLSSDVTEVSLISGSVVTANESQIVKAGTYSISSYKGGTNGNGIIISSKDNKVTLSDINNGESFAVINSSGSSVTYTKTKAGFFNDTDAAPLTANNTNLFKSETLDLSKLNDLKPYTNYHDYSDVITIDSSFTGTHLIGYKGTALATLTASSNKYSLGSDNTHSELHLGEWGGIDITANGFATLVLNKDKFIGSSPLKLITDQATWAIAGAHNSVTSFNITNSTGNSVDTNKITGAFAQVSLISGTLNARKTNVGQNIFTLGSAKDVTVDKPEGSGGFILTANKDAGVTINNFGSDGLHAIGRGILNNLASGDKPTTITIDKDGNTSVTKTVTLTSGKGETLSGGVWKPNSKVTLVYGKDAGISVKNLESANAGYFYHTDGTNTIKTYQVTSNHVLKSYNGTNTTGSFQIWTNKGNNYSEDGENKFYDLNDGFENYVGAVNDNLTIKSDLVTIASGKNEKKETIIDSGDALTDTVYGSLTKFSSGSYRLDGTSAAGLSVNSTLKSVSIYDSLTVNFTGKFYDSTVKVENTVAPATFQILSENDLNFTVSNNTVSNSNSFAEVAGAEEISLISGSILTNDYAQTVKASVGEITYQIRSASSATDGVVVSGNNTAVIIGDIDYGESFYINRGGAGEKKYYRSLLGITDPNGNLYEVNVVSGDNNATVITDTVKPVAVQIGQLFEEKNKKTLIGSESGLYKADESKYVFLVGGGSHTVPAIVVDDPSGPNERYGDLDTVSGGGYVLSKKDSDSVWTNLDIISVAGGDTTIDSVFATNAKNAPVTIMTAGQGGASTSFLVNKTSNAVFTVSGTTVAPAIGNATELTLLDGSITTANQVVKLGASSRPVTVKADTNINTTIGYDKAASLANINGVKNTQFTLAGNAYKVIEGDGMDFVVDDSSGVSIDGLTSAVNDVFTYKGDYYSLKSAGLVKGNSTTGSAIWNKGGKHTLTGDSITVAELDTTTNWSAIKELTNGVATVTPTGFKDSVTFIDSNYTNTYGTLTKTNNAYSLSKASGDNALITPITVTSGVADLTLDDDFTDIMISLPSTNTTGIIVPKTVSGSDYNLTISSKVASLTGVTNASLLGGALKADKNILVTVPGSNGSNYIQASDSSIITLTAGSTNSSVALDVGETFKIDGSTTYSLGSIGLTKNDSILPSLANKNEQNTLAISDITNTGDDNKWFNMFAVGGTSVLIISSSTQDKTLVVDESPIPTEQYASISSSDDGYYLKTVSTVNNSNAWSSDNTISINTSENVTIANANTFKNRPIVGQKSNAVFSVTAASKDFVITDSTNGASIANATKIYQTAGTIITDKTTQTIATADNYSVAYAGGGDGINVAISDSIASVGALNKDDSFSVKFGQSTTKYYLSSDSRIRTDDNKKMWNQTVSGSKVKVSDLLVANDWKGILLANNASLTVDSSSLNLTNNAAYIVNNQLDSDDNDIIYGTITTVTGGGLSMSAQGNSNNGNLSNIKIASNISAISLDSSFAVATFNLGNTTSSNAATVKVTEDDTGGFVVSTLTGNYFAVTEADKLTLESGTIKSTATNQTVQAGSYAIYADTLLGSDSSIFITNDSGKISVGGLDVGEGFSVVDSLNNKTTYKVTEVGIVSGSKLGNDDGWNSTEKVFSVGTAFDTDILTIDQNGELDFTDANRKNDAVVVDDATKLTKRLAKLDYTSGAEESFKLSLTTQNDSIKSISLGTNTVPLTSTYDTIIKTSQGSRTYKINSDSYLAANSALSIQSGAVTNKSSLLSGAVVLDTVTNKSVKITSNTISASEGDGITVTAAGTSATISSLDKGDVFSVGNTAYSLTGAGLLTSSSKMKIWSLERSPASVVIGSEGLGGTSNWSDIVAVSNKILEVPSSNNENNWFILSEDYDSLYGTLSGSNSKGYTFAVGSSDDDWDLNNAVKINQAGMSVAFPAEKFQAVSIEATPSGAKFSVTDNKAFTVTSGNSTRGASITGAEKISQTAGTIALTKTNQIITTSDKHDVNFVETDEGNGITVIIGGNSASISALNTKDNQDTFVVDEVEYRMLSNGSIWRKDGDKFWLGKIDDGGGVGISALRTESNWADAIKIADNILTISSDAINGLSLGFVVGDKDYTKVYGQFTASGHSYTLDGSNVTGTLSGIILDETAQVSLSALPNEKYLYLDVPITAGDTKFAAINATNGFTIDYSQASSGYAASLSSNAPGISLIGGAWNLSDTKQTLTADGQVINVGASSTVTANIISGGVNVTGLNVANEIVTINNDIYKFNSGANHDSGISVSVTSLTSGKVTTVNDITDEDNFAVNNDTFIKKSAGFIKKNTGNFLWINPAKVTDGVAVESLNGNDANTWAGVQTVDGSITINRNSTTAVLIDSVDSLQSIYGAMTVENGDYTLSNKKGAVTANVKPNLITVENVSAGLSGYYARVPIYAAGASFVVNALNSADSLFTVGATNNATLGNVADVNLLSGTLTKLTSTTTVKASDDTIAAATNSTINVGLNGTVVTLSDLDNGEGFNFDRTDYVYRDVGVVRNHERLYVNHTLGGAITGDSLTGATYQTMFASGDGDTLTLQSKVEGVFVDNAGDSVSKVYALQAYDENKQLYTFTQDITKNYTINAASLASGAGISAAFTSQIITPATGTFTVNDKPYTAVNALTIDTNANSSTLNKGTATLASGVGVALTQGDSISVASGNGIQVNAAPNSYTLLELDKDDVFSIGGYSYSMLSDNYLFRTKDGKAELCTASVTGGALSSTIIGSDDYWDNYVLLERDNTLNLSDSSIKDGTVISNSLSAIYADLTVKGNKFALEKITGADTTEISRISLGADDSTLTVDFAATVRTTSGSGTYTVNDSPYTAKDSELEIVTDANSSSITSGVITLNNSPEITTGSNHTVSGTVAELDVAKMSFTPTTGDNFAVDGATYKMNTVGLTKNDSYLWTRSSTESFTLPANDSLWSNMMWLNNDGSLNLRNGVSASSIVVLDNARTKRMALLNYAEGAYSLTSEGGNSIATIQLGDSTDSILSLTANFESSIVSGNGLYKINGNNYRGNGLTITTTDNDSAIYAGTVSLSAGTIYNAISDATNSYEVTGGDGITATATDASITTLGNLNRGDTFTTGGKYYKVLGNQALVQTDSNGGNPSKIYKDLIVSGALDVANILDKNFLPFVEMNADGVIDLSGALGTDGWSAVVLALDDNGDPTIRIAQVSYTDEGGYKLETTSDGDPSTLKSVKLGSAVKTFSSTIDTTVNIEATGTYSINGQPFTAQNDLKIAATNGTEAKLINGAVTLEENVEVTTRRTNSGTQTDETIKTTSGTVTVTVDETAGTVTISGLNPGEKFTFGSNEYTMTPIGLQNGSKLNPTVVTTASVPTTDLDLTGENWLTTLQATNGALTLTSKTPSNVVVVDMTSSTQAVKYGTLTKNGDVYTLTQDDSDSKLASITLNGVRATFGTKASDVDITAKDTTFSVTATGDFTVNAAGTGNPVVSDVSNVSGIYLSAGTIAAPENIPVTASGYAIKATNGDMNISIVDGAAQISELEKDDTFTVDDTTEYKMVDVGLLDVTNQQLRTEVEDTYTIGEAFTRIIAIDENTTNLNLSKETKSADVYDSISEPLTQLGTLTISKGVKTLAAVGNGATVMQSVDIAAKDNLVVTFDTRVNSPIGSVTVNDNTYAGTTALAIDSDGKTSTLYAGTITLDITTPSATDSSNNTLTREVGTFTATAADGEFTTLTGLDNAESFTYNSTTYTQNIPGLINTTDNVICTDILADATITLPDLKDAAWNNFTAPVDAILNISALDSNHIIYDNTTTPTTKYATLTIADGKKTLTGETVAADEISELVIAAGDDLTVDFVTQVDSPIGSVTVNGKSYAGTTELLIDSDGKTSTLYDGTITLNGTNTTATDSSGNVLTRASGSFTATAVEGTFTELNGLDNTESFTYGGTTYVQSAQGLRNGTLIRRDLTGTTIDLSKLGGTWDNMLAPDANGVLDISNFSGNAYVYNSATNPTTQLATLTTADGVKTLTNSNNAADSISTVKIAAGDELAVDFATQINSPIGSVTVNDKDYVGTTELVITSDGTTSTLTDGTISLTNKDDVVTTTGGSVITYTTEDGDSMTIEVDNSGESEAVTFSGLTTGDTFTIGDAAYKVSAVAPMNPAGELWTGGDYANGITLAQINDADNWTPMLAAPDAALSVDAETLADGGELVIVDDVDDPTKIYGDLTKSDDAYTLTRPTTANDDLTSLTVSGVSIELAADYAGVDFTANDSAFSDVTLNDAETSFTLDATSTTPSLSDNVSSLTLTAGTVEAAVNQAVTTGNNVITPTAINGEMIISTETISGIVEGDTFTLNNKAYAMLGTGLFNDTDNKLVTSGIADGTLTIADIVETQLLAINNGELNLSNAAAGNSLIVDTVESPANIYGALNKNGSTYTLDKRADGITSITLPDSTSTLTTDIAATVNAPSSSNTYTVNGKVYKANDSALTIASTATTSTLTDGTINLANENDTVTTTSGSTITYTTDGDGMTVAVTSNGITFSGLTTGDTFTIGDAAYKVSAVAPMNPAGELWTGGDYSEGITLAQINDADNWTPMLAAPDAALSVDAETLADGGELVIVDDVDDPTKIYGDLTKSDDAYTLTRPTTANDNLTSLTVSGVSIELAADYAGVDFVANDSAFSDVTLNDETATFTLDATETTPSLSDNVSSLTLTAGTIEAAVNQAVTTGNNVITPTTINGTMIISTDSISGIVEGDTFTLNDKAYAMLGTGLFNDTDNKLVTSGITDGTLTIADIVETQLLAISNGELNLSNAAAGNSLVVDTVESPANIYGALNKDGDTYKLDKRADGITSITLPDATSTLTTDIAATVNAPSSSNTYTVNNKVYKAKDSALTIASTATTSTLTDGTINLANENDTVTTTSGSTITYTTDGDGMTVAVASDGITFSGLTTGDTFTIGDAAYKVSAVAPMNPAGELWTGGDYANGITLAQINDADNWTPMLAAPSAALSIDTETLSDGGELVIVDNVEDPTKIYGDLTKSGEAYTLTRPTTANDDLTSLTVSGVSIELAADYAGVDFVANDSAFSDVTLNDAEKTFTLDATSTTPSLSDNVSSLTLTAGTIEAAVNQAVTTGNNVITPTMINGTMIISTETISGIVEGDTFTINNKAYEMLGTGLFNDTDNKLVTSGITDGTLTIADIVETQLLAISNGELNLTQALAGNSLIVDTVESPANIYGALNKDGDTYKLDKRADGITSITLPDSTSTLTTDIAATVNAPSSSNTYTVNGKVYKANDSALTIASTATTSTLTDGTISLTDKDDTVTTTSGSTVTYTTGGDGMTVAVTSNGITFSGLTTGDTFTIDSNSYRVSALGFHNDSNYLWTSSTDYKDSVTLNEINDADNWTPTLIAENDSFSVNGETLADGAAAVIIDSATAATKSLGTLSRTGDTYTLTKNADDKKLSALAVDDTKLAIDNQLANVPVTAKGATFTVKANAPYTVDATGNTAAISDDATAIKLTAGTIAATTNQTVTATADSGETSVIGQDNGTFKVGGERFTVADNVGSITFGMTNGVPDSVGNLEKDANVTIDGRTYTAPQDDSTLLFNDNDGWYFDGYVPTKYNITIDGDGNVIVDAGVKFSDVVASGRTLPEDNTIKLAVDVNTIPINVTNTGATAININDKDSNPLVENLGTVENVTFDNAGVMVEKTSDVAGAVFTIDTGQSFETETATITAYAEDCTVGIETNGTSLSVDKAATIDAPADTALTLGNARYTVNGVYFTSGGTAQASLTSDGVKFDLVASDLITYNRTNFDGTGNATAEIDKDRGISLTSGASVDGATGKTFNIDGTVTLDANTIDAATATDVTAKASGYAVANDDVTVTGDEDGYKLNISDGQISGLEYIGGESGVTIGGLNNGTIKTDKVGSMTVADKTFIAVGDASVTYGIENGTLTSASEVDSVITGDFSDGLTVNNGKLQVTGDDVSLDVSRDSNRKVDGFNDKATLTTADNVIKIEPTGAGEFTFGDHVFKVDDATIAFNLRNSSVIGVDSLENGNLIISQDEHNFIVNAESIDLDEINSPVTLEIADSGIHSVYGLHSGMDGLDIATVFGVSSATINNKYFEIAGGTLDAIVVDSVPASLYGLESDMTINSAPSVAIRTTENGTFTFRDDIFNINDTLDGVVVFETDENTHVINIGEFAGSAYGDLKDTALNDKAFSTSSDKVTVISDGTDILELHGLSSGDSISGDLSSATYVMPEGTLNVNDRGYILQGDDDGVSMTGDGLVVVGLDKDASLTVTKGGSYSVNDQDFKAKDGDTFIAGRDYVYIADPNNKPITEKTKIDDIIENLLGKQGKGTISLSGDDAARTIASGNLDSPMALTLDNSNNSSVQTADFSNSTSTKRVTLLGGNQDVKFNDEGGNSAYVDRTARGKKNIELGDGDDVAVNDSPLAKVSIKAGKGSDTIVNRNGAKSTVDVKNNGDTTIVPTSGKVTLQNYDNDNNAKIRTFEYSDLTGAIKNNEIKFGDGVMTLGDAVIVFDPNASEVGGTFANLVDYAGEKQRVGFTHTDGGSLNASDSYDDLILKGNYAENSSDTTKSGASTLIGGRGHDTILAGGDDYVDAGAGENQIYITDKKFGGGDGVTILLAGKGKNTVHNFNSGFDDGDAIKVNDISAVEFIFGDDGLVMRSGKARITFDSLEPATDLISYNDADVAAPYEIKLSDGTNEYNAAIAQKGKDIGVHDSTEANLFYGDDTGLNFSEYTGEVEVNLNNGTGSLNGSAAFFYNINKLQAGSGKSSLIGKAGAKNTLIAGTGNTSMWSAAGKDLMVGNTSEEKDGSTMFYYLAGDGRDTITGFGFMTSADGYNSDIINITADNEVTNVYLRGDNVVMQINNSPQDYLTLVDARGKDFKINNLIAKVDVNAEFDGIANCYVADKKNSTMSVGPDVGDAQVWLDDRQTGQHGIYYLGDIKYLDASTATGKSTLVGNDLDNVIYGGVGRNSIWGGFGDNNDTLIGGTGQNTFFFGMQNGKDIVTAAKDGDIVDLTTIGLEQIASTTINGGGVKLELTDGSSLEIQGSANVEYRLNDGNRYAADHGSGQWIKK